MTGQQAWFMPEMNKLKAENERLLTAIRRIDAINDNPYHFNSEINAECDKILRPELSK